MPEYLNASSAPASNRLRALVAVIAVTAASVTGLVLTSGDANAVTTGATTYTPGTAQLATITNGTSAAPWNEWQGDPGDPAYSSVSPGTVLPTYTPGGATIGSGAAAEPNVAVMPSAASGTDGTAPYPSGTVGSPGPLAGYCGTGNQTTASSGSPVRQPAGTTLPLAPAYFPHIVANADGSLTGYFDYRPKDADEAVEVARSTDAGKDWTYEGEALEQNPGYCPSDDINDDGNGHPNVLTIGGVTRLYTLNRAAGDAVGVGMLVHGLTPTAANPLNGAPTSEQVGIDPNSFVAAGGGVSVPNSGGVTITVGSTGAAGSPLQLIAGGFVDLTVTPTPTASSVITCTGVTATSLTTCTSASPSGETVSAGDLIEQVIGYVGAGVTVPTGPNTTTGDGGLGTITVVTKPSGGSAGFTLPLTGTTLNNNAPNRAYVDGVAIYCDQSNANPTTKIENCTTGTSNPALTATAGDPITADPIVPASATAMTSGLVAPDGIVGVLPSYPGAPAGSTVVMYTEKELAYYVAGTTTNGSATKFSAASTIPFTPGPYVSQDLPAVISAASPVTVSMGDITTSTIVQVTCTGLTTGATTDSLTGCTAPGVGANDQFNATSLIGAPGATTVPQQTLNETGEGSGVPSSAKNIAKLMKNNEDLTVLRVAYTTDGLNFSTSGLDNSGIISGQSNGASNYSDISNPALNASPSNLNAYATPGASLATEMRWVGSAGSIITNPDGSFGLFLSGAWAADGDSDAFNQIFYASSTDGEHWTVPTDVVSTDYTFSASAAQDAALANGQDAPLGISAYYSGRAYGPSIVQNANGTLTMLFAGYRIPKTIANAGTVLGTNASAPYTIGATDPTAYRNIMTETLSSATSPAVGTATSVAGPATTPVTGQQVTYTATVSVPAPGAGTPTGTVTFSDAAGTLCAAVALSETTPDTATCSTTYTSAQSDTVTATYSGDSNYALSSGQLIQQIAAAGTATSLQVQPTDSTFGDTLTLDASVGTQTPGTGTPTGTVSIMQGTQQLTSGTLTNGSVQLSLTGLDAGSYQLVADYAGDGNYAASSSPAVDVTVEKAADGTLTLATPSTGTYGGTATISATGGSSSAPVSVAVVPASAAVCTLTGDSVHYIGVGACTLEATQSGDTNHSGATPVDQTITVAPAPLTVTAVDAQRAYGEANPTFTAQYSGFENGDQATALGGTPQLSTTATATSAPGTYPITAAIGTIADPDYSYTFVAGTLTVTKQLLTGHVVGAAVNKSTVLFYATVTPPGGQEVVLNGVSCTKLTNGDTISKSLPDGVYAIDTATCSYSQAYTSPDYAVGSVVGTFVAEKAGITTAALPAPKLGSSYSTKIAATGGVGIQSWTVSGGALPPGLKLTSAGQVEGTPTTAGTYPFAVTVRWSATSSASWVYSLTVPALAITTSTLKTAKVHTVYDMALATNGGKTPLSWTLAAGSLPAGIHLSTSGTLSGYPTLAGTATFTIKVTDKNGDIATKQFTLQVLP